MNSIPQMSLHFSNLTTLAKSMQSQMNEMEQERVSLQRQHGCWTVLVSEMEAKKERLVKQIADLGDRPAQPSKSTCCTPAPQTLKANLVLGETAFATTITNACCVDDSSSMTTEGTAASMPYFTALSKSVAKKAPAAKPSTQYSSKAKVSKTKKTRRASKWYHHSNSPKKWRRMIRSGRLQSICLV